MEEKVKGTITIIEDVTERVIAERMLTESEERYRRFIEASSDMIFLKDENLRYVLANKAYLDFIGKKEEDIIGKIGYEFLPRDIAERFNSTDKAVLEKDELIVSEEVSKGRTYEVRKFPVTLPNMKKGIGGFVRDVTEQREHIKFLRESRERYHHLNLVLRAMLNLNKVITQEKDIKNLIRQSCKILTEMRGYSHALIFLKNGYNFIFSSSTVFKKEDMEALENMVKNNIPVCIQKAFDTNEIVIVDPILECPICPLIKDMREDICCNVRIEYENNLYGILSISISKQFIDSIEEKELISGVAKDLGFAIFSIEQQKKKEEAEIQLKESYYRLRNIIGSVIDVISLAVESRDPYTAGHQRRVANLARRIAQEMGLTAEQIENVRMAGTIHDLGKIAIPAEILSMPRKLTPIEFELIKQHPKNAYDILRRL